MYSGGRERRCLLAAVAHDSCASAMQDSRFYFDRVQPAEMPAVAHVCPSSRQEAYPELKEDGALEITVIKTTGDKVPPVAHVVVCVLRIAQRPFMYSSG